MPLTVLALPNVISPILSLIRPVMVLSSLSEIPFRTVVSFVMDFRYDEFSKGLTICCMAFRYVKGVKSVACSSEY